ncbi:hypothetical protein [Streptomyces sp. SAS_270]|uniref:hypothetical protein n=1 Tax=Streptomyces sp. SAS_270 TaxID=3412748 RepID=UPI00403C5FE6
MEAMLGIRFLVTEYRTSRHRGRIDALGLDESGTPVIVEYKRSRDQNVVNQALSYLSWLHDHHQEFKSLVEEKLGAKTTGELDWSGCLRTPSSWAQPAPQPRDFSGTFSAVRGTSERLSAA